MDSFERAVLRGAISALQALYAARGRHANHAEQLEQRAAPQKGPTPQADEQQQTNSGDRRGGG
jgi:hypothetical protein